MSKETSILPISMVRHLGDSSDSVCLVLVGCRSDKTAYPCCEYDFVSMSTVPYRDLAFYSDPNTIVEVFSLQKDLDGLAEEQLYPFLEMKFVTGSEFVFSTIKEKIRAALPDSIRSDFSLARLIDASSMARKAQESIENGEFLDCSFWILSAANAVTISIISGGRSQFHPSHMLDSLRKQLKIHGDRWNANSIYLSLGLSDANSSSLRRRMVGLDSLIMATLQLQKGSPDVISARLKLLKARVQWMMDSHMGSQAYCYLGLELISVLERIYANYCQNHGVPAHQTRILSEIVDAERPYRIPRSALAKVGLIHEETILKERLNAVLRSLARVKSSSFGRFGAPINP